MKKKKKAFLYAVVVPQVADGNVEDLERFLLPIHDAQLPETTEIWNILRHDRLEGFVQMTVLCDAQWHIFVVLFSSYHQRYSLTDYITTLSRVKKDGWVLTEGGKGGGGGGYQSHITLNF